MSAADHEAAARKQLALIVRALEDHAPPTAERPGCTFCQGALSSARIVSEGTDALVGLLQQAEQANTDLRDAMEALDADLTLALAPDVTTAARLADAAARAERDEARLAFDAIRIALNVPRTADSPYSPKATLSRVEVICDEAERAFRERDEAIGAGEGSRPSSPVAPDGPESTPATGHRDSGDLQEQLAAAVARAERAEQERDEARADWSSEATKAQSARAVAAEARVRVLEEALREWREAATHLADCAMHASPATEDAIERVHALAAAAAPPEGVSEPDARALYGAVHDHRGLGSLTSPAAAPPSEPPE